MGKWECLVKGEDILKRVVAKRFIEIFKTAKYDKFDVDLYFNMTERIMIYDYRLIVSLLDGSDIESC